MHVQTNKFPGLAWVLAVGTIAHLIYSSLGFNPTDDGFTLAYSRRIIEGQVPHRDFILLRPALSPLMHVPEVLVGGEYIIWLSRFVFWLQFSTIAWLGVSLLAQGTSIGIRFGWRAFLALIAFTLCCHSYPAMAWHTIDGLFLCLIGCRLRAHSANWPQFLGYFLMGAALLCKQGFVFVTPLALLIYGEWRNARLIVAAALPATIYGVMLLATGGWKDAMSQLTSHGSVLLPTLLAIMHVSMIPWILAGICIGFLVDSTRKEGETLRSRIGFWAGVIGVVAVFGRQSVALAAGTIPQASYAVFGVAAGIVGERGLFARKDWLLARTGTMFLVIAWCTMFSVGYATPALASGLLLAFVILAGLLIPMHEHSRTCGVGIIMLAIINLCAFHHARTHHIYREQAAADLTARLDGILPGGNLIRTNLRTYAFLADLRKATRRVQSSEKKYAILSDVAGYWPGAEQANPLPIDWTIAMELNAPDLLHRVQASIESERADTRIIVQKVQASLLAEGFYKLESSDGLYPMLPFVSEHLHRVDETRYFVIYE